MINPTVSRLADGGWHFSWSAGGSGASPYQIWLNGVQIATVAGTSFDVHFTLGDDSVPPDLEIVKASDVAQNKTYPPFVILQWRGVQGVFGYVVEHYTGVSGALWETLALLKEQGKGYYSWSSSTLKDGELAKFRVSAMDSQGNYGNPLTFQSFVVCNPKHPTVSIALSSAGNVVVS